MKKSIQILTIIFFALINIAGHNILALDINILDHGAKADGRTVNTEVIQRAINMAGEQGGGRVVIPSGTYMTGTLIMKSGVTLHLLTGAILMGSVDPALYQKLSGGYALIIADGVRDISITGNGTIDGQGRALALAIDSLHHAGIRVDPGYNYRRMRPGGVRPKIIEFVQCKNIVIEGVAVQNSASWVQNFDRCENLVINDIKVISDAYWNNDGIDVTDCKNVRITNCFVNAADDAICLKSERAGHTNDSIYIANCTIRSSASAVKFGTASVGGFKNVVIENIKVYDTFRSAIAIECVDGGVLENVLVSGIEADNTGNAIFIRLGHRNTDGKVGSLKNVTIRNVKVRVPFGRPDIDYEIRGPELPFFHNPFPSSIAGIPGYMIENVILENIEITHPGRANKGMAYIPLSRLKDVPEQEGAYPEFSMFRELPAWGIYVRHVSGLTLKNIVLRVEEEDFRPAMVFDDVKGLKLSDMLIFPTNRSDQIILKDTDDVDWDRIRIQGRNDDGVREME